jgi:hypothetical protein
MPPTKTLIFSTLEQNNHLFYYKKIYSNGCLLIGHILHVYIFKNVQKTYFHIISTIQASFLRRPPALLCTGFSESGVRGFGRWRHVVGPYA